MDRSVSPHHITPSPSPTRHDDPFRTSIALSVLPTASSGSPSSSVAAQLGVFDSQATPFQGSPPERVRDRLFTEQQSARTDDGLSVVDELSAPEIDSRSIHAILNPRSGGYRSNNLYDMLSTQPEETKPINHHHPIHNNHLSQAPHSQTRNIGPVNPSDGPPPSIMIDIDPNNYHYGPNRGESEDAVNSEDENESGSPSPSLIRDQSQPSPIRSPLNPNPIRISEAAPLSSSHTTMRQSILQDHRSSASPRISAASDALGFVSRARMIWEQERARYQSLSIPPRRGVIRLEDPHSPHNELFTTPQLSHLSPREMALWRWVNVDDLDAFLQEVYSYYVGKGIWAIGLTRLCNLMTVGFVIGFSTFLMGCIDYSILRKSHHLEEVIVPRCVTRFSGLTLMLVLGLSGYYLWKVLRFSQEIAKLWQMREFFTELLEVSEADIQTIPWHGLVDKLSALKHQHPASLAAAEQRVPVPTSQPAQSVLQRKLDAHDVANQIMREQNYLIALFNKDILDLRPPLPSWMVGNALVAEKHLTTSLEWNLIFCLRGYLLDGRGQIQPEFLVPGLKTRLASELRKRFMLMAIINAMFTPFIVVYVLIYSFFRYFEEYHKNPSSISSRGFTRLAQWKFREYNELPHIFQARLIKSYTTSKQYIDQFPKTKTSIVAKFISFVAGSFAAVLIVLSLFDPDAFLHFEVSKDRSVLFYIGLFGSILAISRGMIPKQYEEQIEAPEVLMQHIVQLTHHLPAHWHGKLHSIEVYNEFCELFQLKIVIFLQELMSVILTPFILWYSFSDERCEKIIDFFKEFTIHVEGIGYVCSFAVFDFDKLGNDPPEPRQNPHKTHNPPASQHTRSHHHQDVSKVERSLLNFVAHHPNWEPSNQTASLYLSRAIGVSAADSMLQPHPPQFLNSHFPPANRLSGHSAIGPSGLRPQRSFNPSILQVRSGPGIHSSMLGTGAMMRSGMLHGVAPPMGISSSRRSTSVGRSRPNASVRASQQAQWKRPGQTNASTSSDHTFINHRKPVMGVEAIDEEGEGIETTSNKQKKKKLSNDEDEEDPFQTTARSEIGADSRPTGMGAMLNEVLTNPQIPKW